MKQINLTAHFGSSTTTDSYTLTVKSGTNGKLSTGIIVLNGSNMKASFSSTAIPDSGYCFVKWTDINGDTQSDITDATITFVDEYITADRSITANFDKISTTEFNVYTYIGKADITTDITISGYPYQTHTNPTTIDLEADSFIYLYIQVPKNKTVTSIYSTGTSNDYIGNAETIAVGTDSILYKLEYGSGETADTFKITIK
jgi:hypothetical protein